MSWSRPRAPKRKELAASALIWSQKTPSAWIMMWPSFGRAFPSQMPLSNVVQPSYLSWCNPKQLHQTCTNVQCRHDLLSAQMQLYHHSQRIDCEAIQHATMPNCIKEWVQGKMIRPPATASSIWLIRIPAFSLSCWTPSPKIISISGTKNEPKTSPLCCLSWSWQSFPFCSVAERDPVFPKPAIEAGRGLVEAMPRCSKTKSL